MESAGGAKWLSATTESLCRGLRCHGHTRRRFVQRTFDFREENTPCFFVYTSRQLFVAAEFKNGLRDSDHAHYGVVCHSEADIDIAHS